MSRSLAILLLTLISSLIVLHGQADAYGQEVQQQAGQEQANLNQVEQDPAAVAQAAQQDTTTAVDQAFDIGEGCFILQSRNQLLDHAEQFSRDFGFLDPASMIPELEGLDPDAPLVAYHVDDSVVARFRIGDHEKLDVLAVKNDPDPEVRRQKPDWSSPVKCLEPDILNSVFVWSWGEAKQGWGIVDGDWFIYAEEKENLDAFANAKPLSDSLSEPMKKMLNESGVSWLSSSNELDMRASIEVGDYPAEHLALVDDIESILEKTTYAGAGLTYEEERFKIVGAAMMDPVEATGRVFDLKALARPFEPTLGLPADRLLASFSFQTEIFKDPTVISAMPALTMDFLNMNSRYVGYKLASAAFAFFSELHGEVTSFRLAVYDGTDIEDASHCLVAVLDTNDGDEFLKQFGELVEIVNPAPDPETQKRLAEEIGRLIVQLDDPKFAIRESASNRLKLIGASALPFLKSVEGGSYERKSRIEQLISHATIDPSEQTRNFQLTEPGFWANLRPSFSLSAAPEPFAEKPTYVLKMHKAASIPASQWNEASDMVGGLFGADWDQLKLIRMDNRFILMMGDDSRRLEETMSNLENGSDPLAEQDGGREMTRRSGQFHFRVSVARMVRAFFDEHYVAKDGFEEDYQTTLTLNIAEQDWGVCFYLPVQEIWPIITADMENRKTR